jgi:HPt (histidine-containing phosphotransfer) domain-containing protein
MDDYISKPIDRQMLKIKLNHWLQKDMVLKNQELARKYAQPGVSETTEEDPIDLVELEEFYADDLKDVLATFVENTEKLLVEINQSILDRKDVQLAHMAHELKGSSASVGAKGLAKLGLFLERAAGLRDWHDAKDTFAALTYSFSRVKEFLKQQHSTSHEAVILPRKESPPK